MKTMLLCSAAVALSLAVGPAHADGGGQATTVFTMMQDRKPTTPSVAVPVQKADEVTHSYLTQSKRSTWLFAPAEGGNG